MQCTSADLPLTLNVIEGVITTFSYFVSRFFMPQLCCFPENAHIMTLGDISILEAQIRKPNARHLKRFRKFVRNTSIFTLTNVVLPSLLTLLLNILPFGTFWVVFCLFHVLKYRTPSHSKLAILFAVLLLFVALATIVMNIYGVFYLKKLHEKIFCRKTKIT